MFRECLEKHGGGYPEITASKASTVQELWVRAAGTPGLALQAAKNQPGLAEEALPIKACGAAVLSFCNTATL